MGQRSRPTRPPHHQPAASHRPAPMRGVGRAKDLTRTRGPVNRLWLSKSRQLPTPYPEPHRGHQTAKISSMNGTTPLKFVEPANLERADLSNSILDGVTAPRAYL